MIKKILTYATGEVLVKGASFLALPLYSYLILPSEYGTLGFLRSVTAFLPFILTFYYLYAYVRLSVHTNETLLLSTYFYLGIFLNIFYLASAFALYFLFVQYYTIELHYFIMAILSSAFIYMFQILQMYYRSKGLAKSYIRLSLVYALGGLGLNFLFLFIFEDNVFAMLLSSSSITFIASLVAYTILHKKISWSSFDFTLVREILRYSIPLIPGAIALLLFSSSDKIILAGLVTKESLGIYTFAFTVGLTMSYIGNAFFMSYQPLFYDKIAHNKHSEIINAFPKNILFLTLALLLSYFIISLVYFSVNQRYSSGIMLSLSIATAYSYLSFAQMMELHLTYLNKTALVSWVYSIGGAITVIGLLTLIPMLGLKGATLALLLAGFVISVFMYILAQKHLYLQYNIWYAVGFYLFTFISLGFIL